MIFTVDAAQAQAAEASEAAARELDHPRSALKVELRQAARFCPRRITTRTMENNAVKYNFYRFSCGWIGAWIPSGVIRREPAMCGVEPSNPVEFLKKPTFNLLKRLSATGLFKSSQRTDGFPPSTCLQPCLRSGGERRVVYLLTIKDGLGTRHIGPYRRRSMRRMISIGCWNPARASTVADPCA